MPTLPGDHIHGRAIVSDGCAISDGGLTKREHFAAMAMQGIMANADPQIYGLGTDRVAEWAVGAGDALIAALNKARA